MLSFRNDLDHDLKLWYLVTIEYTCANCNLLISCFWWIYAFYFDNPVGSKWNFGNFLIFVLYINSTYQILHNRFIVEMAFNTGLLVLTNVKQVGSVLSSVQQKVSRILYIQFFNALSENTSNAQNNLLSSLPRYSQEILGVYSQVILKCYFVYIINKTCRKIFDFGTILISHIINYVPY